jgi:hypothetical protein
MKARRIPALAAFCVLTVLALTGLGACGADPSVAAYVGGVQITEAEVDDLMAELEGALGIETAQQRAEIRGQLVELRVLTEAATAYAEAEGLELPAPGLEAQATQLGLDRDSPAVRVVAEFSAAMGMLSGSVEPARPTEADQREVYDNLVAEGLTNAPFEQAQPDLNRETIGGPVALRNLIVEVVDRADIRVNPRYDLVHRVVVPLGGVQTWLSVPLGDSAVVEAG